MPYLSTPLKMSNQIKLYKLSLLILDFKKLNYVIYFGHKYWLLEGPFW